MWPLLILFRPNKSNYEAMIRTSEVETRWEEHAALICCSIKSLKEQLKQAGHERSLPRKRNRCSETGFQATMMTESVIKFCNTKTIKASRKFRAASGPKLQRVVFLCRSLKTRWSSNAEVIKKRGSQLRAVATKTHRNQMKSKLSKNTILHAYYNHQEHLWKRILAPHLNSTLH